MHNVSTFFFQGKKVFLSKKFTDVDQVSQSFPERNKGFMKITPEVQPEKERHVHWVTAYKDRRCYSSASQPSLSSLHCRLQYMIQPISKE